MRPMTCRAAESHIRIALISRFDSLGTAEIERVAGPGRGRGTCITTPSF